MSRQSDHGDRSPSQLAATGNAWNFYAVGIDPYSTHVGGAVFLTLTLTVGPIAALPERRLRTRT